MENIIKEKIAHKGNHRGYTFTATYLTEPAGEALIEIHKGKELIREFSFPAYKIFNIAAHAEDIVNGLERDSDSGLYIAGSTGLGGSVYIEQALKGKGE